MKKERPYKTYRITIEERLNEVEMTGWRVRGKLYVYSNEGWVNAIKEAFYLTKYMLISQFKKKG